MIVAHFAQSQKQRTLAKNKRADLNEIGPLTLEATAGFEPAMGVLQTPALPLGYVAIPG